MKKTIILILILLTLYAAFRVGGLHASYYQDELDWVVGILGHTQIDPHPPLSSLVYEFGKMVFGLHNLRAVPFLIGALNLILLWVVVKRRIGSSAAFFSTILFVISFASVLGSLMIDVDGQWLPFLFLLALYALDRWRDSTEKKAVLFWAGLATTTLIIGLLTKFSFAIAIGAIAIELLLIYRAYWRKYVFWYTYSGYWVGVASLVIGGMFFGQFLTQNYSTGGLVTYTERFFTLNRGWLQIIIQAMKSVFYFSPVIILPSFILDRKRLSVLRPFFLFLGLTFLFYFVFFDFSAASLDRYLLIATIPLCVIAGTSISDVLHEWRSSRKIIGGVLLICFFLILLQCIPQTVVPQYPKGAWFERVLSGHWAFLMPFSGGSGPLGFYESWLMIGFTWAISVVTLIIAFFHKIWRPALVFLILGVSLVYNLLFIEEYQYGLFNGSAQRLLHEVTIFISQTPSVRKVITYNDIGAYELQRLGVYERRLYAAPKFEAGYVDVLKNFRGHYLVIDIPQISIDSQYVKFWNQCPVVFTKTDHAITAKIYDCRRPTPLP